MIKHNKNDNDVLDSGDYISIAFISFILFATLGPLLYAVLKNMLGFNDDYSGLIAIGSCIFVAYKIFTYDNKTITQTLDKSTAEDTANAIKKENISKKQDKVTDSSLTEVQKIQQELDRYTNAHHSREEIGLFYERYIGYIFESKGWQVLYYGAQKGKKDEGIDLICTKDNRVRLVQCKYWSKNKTIFEKHIFQLYGTWQLKIKSNDFPSKRIDAYFITSTILSEYAKDSADKLDVKIQQSFELKKNYPKIKCTTTKSGEKIYHLPNDQQYDNILMNKDSQRFYVHTVADAVAKGHRRAYRYMYNN